MISFDLVKKQVSDLFIAFENIQTEAKQSIDETKSADLHRKEANDRLVSLGNKMKLEESRLIEERAYLVTVRTKQKEKELQLASFEVKKKESELLVEGANKRISEAAESVKTLEQKKKDYDDSIGYKTEDLKKRESLIQKSESIDRDRKELLDARENKIRITEERLQRLAS